MFHLTSICEDSRIVAKEATAQEVGHPNKAGEILRLDVYFRDLHSGSFRLVGTEYVNHLQLMAITSCMWLNEEDVPLGYHDIARQAMPSIPTEYSPIP